MKRFWILFLILMMISCSTAKKVVVERVVKDTTIVNVKDSTVIVPVEVVRDAVPQYDTLRLSTSLAESETYVDTTTHTLKGRIWNTKEFKERVKTEYKYITKFEKVPEPYEVEKVVKQIPKTYWPLLIYFILSLLLIGTKIYLKFRK